MKIGRLRPSYTPKFLFRLIIGRHDPTVVLHLLRLDQLEVLKALNLPEGFKFLPRVSSVKSGQNCTLEALRDCSSVVDHDTSVNERSRIPEGFDAGIDSANPS